MNKSKQSNNDVSVTTDTIVALATPVGCAGVAIVRLSGPDVISIAKQLIGKLPKPRHAVLADFTTSVGTVIDQGLVIYFSAPNSFTGEDVLELQGHGGAVVVDQVIQQVIKLGARLARPGEFSERAFLNGKIDLTQAEAIADLVCASSQQAAQASMRTLQGEFAEKINVMRDKLINLRTYLEAEIDFTEEDIDLLTPEQIQHDMAVLQQEVATVIQQSSQGVLLREGVKVVISGKPNVGKSSLLNYFCKRDSAIVTDIPGTTRDVLREYINLDGLPLHIIDTAGIRESDDAVEVEGVKRAWQEMQQADFILLLIDSDVSNFASYADFSDKLVIVRNKIDLTKFNPKQDNFSGYDTFYVSVKTGAGLELLESYLKQRAGYQQTTEGVFSARRRHIEALETITASLHQAATLLTSNQPRELLAEELRLAQVALGEITGEVYTDDLLARIFADFCVGK